MRVLIRLQCFKISCETGNCNVPKEAETWNTVVTVHLDLLGSHQAGGYQQICEVATDVVRVHMRMYWIRGGCESELMRNCGGSGKVVEYRYSCEGSG